MRRSATLSFLVICLLILCASSFVLLNKVGAPTPAMQSESRSVTQSLDQASLNLKQLQKFRLMLPPGAPPQARAQQDQQITQLENEIASLQAQLADNRNKQSNDMLTEMIAVVGALGGLIGSIATLTTALRGPLKA